MGSFTIPRLSPRAALALSLALVLATAAVLLWMGRSPGEIRLWHGGKADAGVSQHLTDFYTYSHLVRGVVLYWLLWAAFRGRLSVAARLVIAVLIEGAWEIVQNTPFIVDRYRTQAISPGYGDAVINSAGDMLAAMLGFLAASRLPAWVTVMLLIAVEVVLFRTIGDNLLLSLAMQLYPLEWVSQWQLHR